MFSKVHLFLIFTELVLVLSLGVSPSQATQSSVHRNELLIIESQSDSYNAFVIVNINQASNFNHVNQTCVDYIYIALIALFLVLILNYQWFKPCILPPPWYIVIKRTSRLYLANFKVCNLQYKAQLTYQDYFHF